MSFQAARAADDVVITGYGAITPLGHDVESFSDSLRKGMSAVDFLEPHQGVDGTKWMAAVIRNFDPKQHVQPRKTIKVMCREIQLAFGAAMQACRVSGVSAGMIEPDRLGTVFSGEIIFSEIGDAESIIRLCSENGIMKHDRWAAESMENMYPLWMLKSLPNMAACHVGIALDARGPNNTITTEGTSSLNALLEAINVIRRDKADVMIVGSTASRSCFTRLLQRHEEDFSKSYGDVAKACKPFDASRDGTVPGESASAVVLERRSHAEARGAKILGTILSWANTFAGSPDRWGGIQQSTESALSSLLTRSGLVPSGIDHVNASASGIVSMDAGESRGIANVLSGVPVVSYKGAIGDSISGAGLIEWIASMSGMQSGIIAPTTNHCKTASDCPVDVISQSGKQRSTNCFVKLSSNSQGHTIGVLTRVD
jgi:3-oxoacyl-[acyl-carrier-protein] synthase II